MNSDEFDQAAREVIDLCEKTSHGIFARLSWGDWEKIKQMPTEEIRSRLKGINYSLKHSVSVSDMELKTLLELELEKRRRLRAKSVR
jgi:hypothetical protein